MVRIHLSMQELLEMQVRSLGWEDPLEEETAARCSIPARVTLWGEEPGGLQSWCCRESDTERLSAHTRNQVFRGESIQFFLYCLKCSNFWNLK